MNLARRAFAHSLFVCAMAPAVAQMQPPVHDSGQRNYHARSYRLRLSFDWPEQAVIGDELFTLEPASSLRELDLDAGDSMRVRSVEIAGAALAFTHNGEKLHVSLPAAYEAGQSIVLRIRYRARPRVGLKFLVPDENNPQRPRQIWTVGEPRHNHNWFVCYDSPGELATVETTTTVEDGFRVIANGRLLGTRRNTADNTIAYHWRIDQPIPPYLVSIVVGRFDEIQHPGSRVPMFSYVPAGRIEEGRLALESSPAMMRFFASRLGVPYPYAKYSQTLVADFPGGVENTSATTLGETLLHPARLHAEETRGVELLLAHEMAHSWFGSLVGPADWRDIWLNESFATYFAHLYEEEARGSGEFESEMWSVQQASIADWNAGNHRALAVSSYADPDELFDDVIYARGAAVLHMLRFVLGDELWWKSLRHYLTSNQYRPLDTLRLRTSLEETSGRDLGWFFDEWITQAAIPEFTVTSAYDEGSGNVSVRVRQSKPAFQMPADICLADSRSERAERVWISRGDETFRFHAETKPAFVAFDCTGRLLKILHFEKSATELAAQARTDVHVAGRLWATAELASSHDATALETLAGILAEEPESAVRVEAVRSLAGSNEPGATQRLMAALHDPAPEVRREYLKALGRTPPPDLENQALTIIAADRSDSVVAEAVRTLATAKSERARTAIRQALDRPSRRDAIRVAALHSFIAGVARDPQTFSTVVVYARAPYSAAVRSAALSAALRVAPDSPEAREQLFALARAALFAGGGLKLAAAKAFAELHDTRAVPLLEMFLANDPNPGPFDLSFRDLARTALVRLHPDTADK